MEKFVHKKSLGQHFIKDPQLHEKIASKAGDLENFTVLEIGPGDGGLTRAILKLNPQKLVIIEKDRDLIPILKKKFDDNGKIEIMEGDATDLDIKKLVNGPTKVIANLPYNIATNLILTWLENFDLFTSITVLIQKEVADRFLANIKDKSYGRVAILTKLMANVKREFDVPPGAFTPAPKVDSTLITFHHRPDEKPNISWKELAHLTKIAFLQPRKTIFNNLKQCFPNIENILDQIFMEKNLRPENLSLDDFIKIYKEIKKTC